MRAVGTQVDVSVVIPVVERYNDLELLYTSYAKELNEVVSDYEFIFVVDGHMNKAYKEVKALAANYPQIKVIKFTKTLGESMALNAGFKSARGGFVFTLASYFQVEPAEIKKLYRALKSGECDIAVSRRERTEDSAFNRLQSGMFHRLLKIFTGSDYSDIACGLRGMKKDVLDVFDIYGDLHRFIPIISEHQGLKVKEIPVRQKKEDTSTRFYGLRTYINRVVDVVTIFFLLRFTYKPLRFFGIIGSVLILTGLGIVTYLVYQRLFYPIGLSDRPALFLSSLLMVIGIQVFAIGLIGEMIIYTHSSKLKRFNIKDVIEKR